MSSVVVPVLLNLISVYFKLCMYPISQGKTLFDADEAHLISNIFDLLLPYAGETLLSGPLSTIPDPPMIDLDLDPPKTGHVVVVEDRHRSWRSISLILILWIKDILVDVLSMCFDFDFWIFIYLFFDRIFGCVKCIFWMSLL